MEAGGRGGRRGRGGRKREGAAPAGPSPGPHIPPLPIPLPSPPPPFSSRPREARPAPMPRSRRSENAAPPRLARVCSTRLTAAVAVSGRPPVRPPPPAPLHPSPPAYPPRLEATRARTHGPGPRGARPNSRDEPPRTQFRATTRSSASTNRQSRLDVPPSPPLPPRGRGSSRLARASGPRARWASDERGAHRRSPSPAPGRRRRLDSHKSARSPRTALCRSADAREATGSAGAGPERVRNPHVAGRGGRRRR